MQIIKRYRSRSEEIDTQRRELEETLRQLQQISSEMHKTNKKVNDMLTSRRGA